MLEKTRAWNSSIPNLVKFAIGWPISLIALFFIVKIIIDNGKSLLPNLANINLTLLVLGIFFFILYYLIRAYVWKIILKLQGYDLPFKHVAYLWELSEFKRFAPGKVWSFIGRSSVFGDLNIPQKTIFKSILIEIQFLIFSNAIISILAFPFVFQHIIKFPSYDLALAVTTLFILLVAVIYIFSTSRHSDKSRRVGTHPECPNVQRDSGLASLLPKLQRRRARMTDMILHILPSYSPKTKISTLSISCLSTIFFGLGTYFSVLSVVYLPLELFTQILGFFVFSYIVSYLSFITPMGIGVREGILTIGLSKIISFPLAGMASIFARIVLIVSELCFLGITYLWKTTKSKYILFLENIASARKHEVVLIFIVIAYIIYFTSASFLRYDNFYTGRFDLGNMDQTLWNTINGRIFETTKQTNFEPISRISSHADFILIFLALLYLIWENAKMLLFVQSVVLGLGAIFVYAISKNVVKNNTLSLVFSFLFLLNPAVQYTNLYDFHAVTLATTFLLGAFYFLLKNRYLLFILFTLLAALTKEQIWAITALFGLYVFSRTDKEKLLGLITFLVSISIFYFLIWHAIPSARGEEHFALSYYSEFGESPGSIIRNVFLSPQKTLETFFQKEQMDYLRQLFLPLGFLSFLSPLYLIFALPDLFINLLSSNLNLHQIYYQYSAAITPFIFISAIYGVKNLKSRFPKIPYTLATSYLLLATCYSAYSYGPLPFAKKPNIAMFARPLKEARIIEDFLVTIPQEASVAATNNVGSHVSQRQKIATVPVGFDKADYVLFLLNDESSRNRFSHLIESLQSNKNYEIVYQIGDFVAFKKN